MCYYRAGRKCMQMGCCIGGVGFSPRLCDAHTPHTTTPLHTTPCLGLVDSRWPLGWPVECNWI